MSAWYSSGPPTASLLPQGDGSIRVGDDTGRHRRLHDSMHIR